MNEKDGEMAGSSCLISVPGIICSKEGIPLVPTGIEIQNNNDFLWLFSRERSISVVST